MVQWGEEGGEGRVGVFIGCFVLTVRKNTLLVRFQ